MQIALALLTLIIIGVALYIVLYFTIKKCPLFSFLNSKTQNNILSTIKVLGIVIFVFIIIPIIVDYIVIGNNTIITFQSNSQWSSFLGSYLGGGVGAFVTLAGVWWQVTRQEGQAAKDKKKSFLLGLKYNIEKNLEFESKEGIIEIFLVISYSSNLKKLDESEVINFLYPLNSNGVKIDFNTIYEFNFYEKILRLNDDINELNRIYIFLLFNSPNKANLLTKMLEKNIPNSKKIFEFSEKIIQEIRKNKKDEIFKYSITLEEYVLNSIRKIREANPFYDMNYEREVIDKIIDYLYTFYSYDMGLLKCNIFKIMEEIQDLKEKIDIELGKYK